MNLSSKILEQAVDEFAKLPGVGSRTALRLVLHLLKQSPQEVENFGLILQNLKKDIHICKICFNIADSSTCEICANRSRKKEIICVVQDIRDVMAIEQTSQYNGTFHVLGGLISPMDSVGPSDLAIEPLIERVKNNEVKEIILALSATMEGDTTIFYLYKKLQPFNILISTIARGIAIGGELEYTDEVTLARSIATRIPYENNLKG
jgi:recombination protein RecR